MKRVFCAFFVFFIIFFVAGGVVHPKCEEKVSAIEDTFNRFDSLYRNINRAGNASDVISTDFGNLQVLSADSGTDNVKTLLFALTMNVTHGYLTAPRLTFTDTQNMDSWHVLYPAFFYQDGIFALPQVAIPFYVDVTNAGKDVAFHAIAEFNWCQNAQECTAQKYVVPMHVASGPNAFSPYTAFIINAMQYVPLPADAQQVSVHRLDTDSLWVLINSSKKIQKEPPVILLDKDNHPLPYTRISQTVLSKKALFVLSAPDIDKIAQIMTRINRQWYTQRMDFSAQPLPEMSKQSAPKERIPFYAWVIFVMCSPVISLLYRLNVRNEVCARKILQNKIIGVFVGIVSVYGVYWYIPYDYLQSSILWLSFCCLLYVVCAFRMAKLNSFSYGILVGLFPYFSVLRWLNAGADYSQKTYVLFCVALLNIIPFVVLWVKPRWAVKWSKTMPMQAFILTCLPMILCAITFAIMMLLRIQ